ncbi:MAG: replicative DNA helicase [Chloroflexi bacterium]|nr:replicative DNA helicase [Chloroflexota bacterium]
MTSERLPPHDTDAEENVIGSLLIDGEAIYKVAEILHPADFYAEANAILFQSCLELYDRNVAIDQVTVAQELARKGKLEECGSIAYLNHLITEVPTSLHLEHYAQIVSRLATMRRLINASNQISAIGYGADPDVDGALDKSEDILFRLRFGRASRGFVPLRKVLSDYMDSLDTPETGTATVDKTTVFSGFAAIDDQLTGLNPSDLVIIAGRPSMGKTSLALSIARNAAIEQGACVALFSLEMDREALAQRLLANESGINSRDIPVRKHDSNVVDAAGRLSEAQIYIDDSPLLRIVEMRSKARRLDAERKINLIVLDYLQLMQEDSRSDNRVQEMSYISRSLKAIARELNAPVIALSQLSRQVEFRASHVPQLSDLRESGSIEQDADVVVFIYRDDYYYSEDEWRAQHAEPYPRGVADIIIAKHRNGPTGQVKLRFSHKLARFENITNEELSLL